MDKTFFLILFPFFTIVLLVGFVAYYARGGKPIRLELAGLGIRFTLEGRDAQPGQSTTNTENENG